VLGRPLTSAERVAVEKVLERALTEPEEFGIWGGTTPHERSLLPSRRRARL